ncbi:MAG: hypothetical protein U0807_16780 [Candidatus Binatia bacterium]
MRLGGRLIGLFSFDVGYEIDLDRARTLTDEGDIGAIARRRAAPVHLRYAVPPLRVPLGTRGVTLGDTVVDATASAVIHEFGAVTIVLQAPLACDVAALPPLTATLTGAGPLEDAARVLVEELGTRIRPAVTRPFLNEFVEDYYIVQIGHCDPPTSIPELLETARGPLASALRCEAVPLSDTEVDDVFRTRVSYYPDDLVVTEWNVALVVDTDFADTVSILEYLNVQLLELRFYDALLDRRLADTHAPDAARPSGLPFRYRRYRRAIEDLAAIRVDVATIVERVHNALKLSGDLYLAKIYTRTAERLALRAWEESVAQKLDVLQQRYDVLVQRMATARSEALEATIIVLIVLELVVLLAGWG